MTVRAKYLRIPEAKWDKHQHYYKGRKEGSEPPADWRPTWIKLYVKLLDDFDLRELPPDARFVYVALLLIASQTGNLIPSSAYWLGKRLTMSEKQVQKAVKSLVRNGLIEPFSASSSRKALDDLYPLIKEVRSKKLEPRPLTDSKDVAAEALGLINDNLRGVA